MCTSVHCVYAQSLSQTRCSYIVQSWTHKVIGTCAEFNTPGVDKCATLRTVKVCAESKRYIYVQSLGQCSEGLCENKRVAPALDLCQALLRLALLHAVMVIIILPVITHVILLSIIISIITRLLFIILSSWQNICGSNYFQV